MWLDFISDITGFGNVIYLNFIRLTEKLQQSVASAILDPAAPDWVADIVNSSGLGNITVFGLMFGGSIFLVVGISLARWLKSPLR